MQPRSSHSSRGVKETDAAAIQAAVHGGTGPADEPADGAPVAAKQRAKPRQQGGAGPRVSVPPARRPIDPLPAEGRWEDTAEGPREDDVLAPPGQAGGGDAETAPAGEPGGPGAAASGTPAPEAPGHRAPAAPEVDPWAEVALPEVTLRAAPAAPRGVRPARGPQPGWGTVLVTTVKLWSRRRLAEPASRVRSVVTTWRFVLALAVAAVIFVAGAITVALSGSRAPASSPRPGQQAGGAPPGTTGGGLATATVTRQQAALWVFQQVSSDAVVSCDPAMCSVLEQYGVPAGRLLTLRPGQTDPLGSDVVVATPAVRSEFGSRLATVYAPVTLAVFGSGSTLIDIRAIAPDGAAAYSGALSADQRARKLAGEEMATNPRIAVGGTARRQLAAGRVDSRLLVTLTTLAAMHPVSIMRFGGSPGTGTAPDVPLRSADIAAATPAGVLRHFFNVQRPPYHAAGLEVLHTGPRGTVLRVMYPAPSPLGLLGTRS
jgi:hypothetical protein